MFGFIILSLIVGSNFSVTIPPGETIVPGFKIAHSVYEQEPIQEQGFALHGKGWQEPGVPVCTRPGDQWYPKGTPDGAYGVIVCWWDRRDDNVYAQRLDKDGNILWQINGIPLFANPTLGIPYQLLPQIISDGDFGAIVVGNMGVHGDPGFYAQRVDSAGDLLWGENGVKLSSLYTGTAWMGRDNFQITHDGSDGAIVAFTWNGNVYAQRVDATGTIQWGIDGMMILEPQFPGDTLVNPSIVSDGSGGAIIVATQFHAASGIGWRILAQRVDSTGSPLWGTSGVHTGLQDFFFQSGVSYPKMVSDGVGGAIVASAASSFLPTFQDLYVQRIDKDGNLLWGPDGVHLAGDPPDTVYGQQMMSVKEDGEGGAIFCWSEVRPEGDAWDWNLEAQRVDTAGNILWAENGTLVSTEFGWPLMAVEWDTSIIIPEYKCVRVRS